MDKTIVVGGITTTGLGVGFLVAYQAIPDLHVAYLLGGYMWTGLGAITSAIGLKKQERLSQKKPKVVQLYPKSAVRVE